MVSSSRAKGRISCLASSTEPPHTARRVPRARVSAHTRERPLASTRLASGRLGVDHGRLLERVPVEAREEAGRSRHGGGPPGPRSEDAEAEAQRVRRARRDADRARDRERQGSGEVWRASEVPARAKTTKAARAKRESHRRVGDERRDSAEFHRAGAGHGGGSKAAEGGQRGVA